MNPKVKALFDIYNAAPIAADRIAPYEFKRVSDIMENTPEFETLSIDVANELWRTFCKLMGEEPIDVFSDVGALTTIVKPRSERNTSYQIGPFKVIPNMEMNFMQEYKFCRMGFHFSFADTEQNRSIHSASSWEASAWRAAKDIDQIAEGLRVRFLEYLIEIYTREFADARGFAKSTAKNRDGDLQITQASMAGYTAKIERCRVLKKYFAKLGVSPPATQEVAGVEPYWA